MAPGLAGRRRLDLLTLLEGILEACAWGLLTAVEAASLIAFVLTCAADAAGRALVRWLA